MKRNLVLTLAGLASACACLAQTATTAPVGYVSITCLPNSDTIVGVPLRQSAAFSGSLASKASNVFTLSGTPALTVNAFAGTHYVKFKTSTATPTSAAGEWFPITANTEDTLTVDLNGATANAVADDTLEIVKFWTLAELFDPSQSTTDPATTENAIVASTGTLVGARRTQVLLPNLLGVGVNLSAGSIFYVHNGIWKKVGNNPVDENFGTMQLWPDNYLTIRHPATVTSQTIYTASGEVETGDFKVSLNTRINGNQDNMIALPRPIDVKLRDLGLTSSTSAFIPSTGTLVGNRRDQLLVFNNSSAGLNKSASATYYFHNNIWKKVGALIVDTDYGDDVIKSGQGILIRKYTSTGTNVTWNNPANY